MMLRISTGVRSASCQWVMSACQRSLGISAQNRLPARLGRLFGCGVTNPRRVRTRQIVEVDGSRSAPIDCRWVRIVSAPASRPFFDSSLRSRTIRSSRPRPIARGLV
jgi:hypothetical protein